METYVVKRLATAKQYGAFILVLANTEDGMSGTWVELQIGTEEPGEQEKELGMDTYCIYLSWGGTHYGGVTKYEVNDDALTLHFDAVAQRELRARGGVRFELQVDAKSKTVLRRAVRKIFKGVPHGPEA
jgi:hypothetical protein